MEQGLLLVGLGNPGPRHAGNRHNFGFFVLDRLAPLAALGPWQEKFSGLFCRGQLEGRQVSLLKPATFMNRSGLSVSRAAHFFQTPISAIVVVHDDLDLPFGVVRIKKAGGTGGHKGLASIIESLGEPDFARVRMGIGRPPVGDATDYVLQNFSAGESALLDGLVDQGVDAARSIVGLGVEAAMNRHNRRGGESDAP